MLNMEKTDNENGEKKRNEDEMMNTEESKRRK